MVSYYDYGTTFSEFDMINVLRWKLLTIKINLSVDAVYLEDFVIKPGQAFVFIINYSFGDDIGQFNFS